MKQILHAALEAIESRQRVALATIVSARGSLPMSRRSKMLILEDGSMRGTVGGGCLEAEIFAEGREILKAGGPPRLRRFTLTESQAGVEGLNCGGTVEVMTEAFGPGPVEEVLRSCLDAIDRREEAVLATSLDAQPSGSTGKILVRADRRVVGSIGDARMSEASAALAASLMGTDAIAVESVADRRVFLETILVTPTALFFGGGHVTRHTARVARTAGFRIVIVDDRPAFANRERHPDADETLVLPMESAFESLVVDPHTFVVSATRGHQHDEVVVRQALRSAAGYVGMLGSARKVAILKTRLAAEGFDQATLDRLHAPIGLEIGADDPGEIAVSIVAELIAFRRRAGDAASLRRRHIYKE
ncbi:MAG TPA: XdhC family protein [Verrucomicrobiae bacterium]|nr:XdhC family protein [Verrucomicrobiae bacterium]